MGPTRVFTLEQRLDLKPALNEGASALWPEFMLHDAVAERCWRYLGTDFARYQVVVCDADEVVAVGNCVPVVWDGTVEGLPEGWDAVLEQGVRDQGLGRAPNTLCGLSATVAQARRGRRLLWRRSAVCKSWSRRSVPTSSTVIS